MWWHFPPFDLTVSTQLSDAAKNVIFCFIIVIRKLEKAVLAQDSKNRFFDLEVIFLHF